MVNVISIPYSSFKDKIRIIKENKGIKFEDVGSVLMYIEFIGVEEENATSLCWKEKHKVVI